MPTSIAPAQPSPQAVLAFARHVFTRTQNRRAEQLAAGQIDQAKFDADTLAAAELLHLAEDAVIFGGPPLN